MASIGSERIKLLMQLADKRFNSGKKGLSNRYVELARKISMKSEESIPSRLKRKYCRSCGVFLRPSDNCKVRLKDGEQTVVYTCLECGESETYGTEME